MFTFDKIQYFYTAGHFLPSEALTTTTEEFGHNSEQTNKKENTENSQLNWMFDFVH